MPRLVETVEETRQALKDLRKKATDEATVGFVPTMGALHRGHAALIDAAQKENEIVVVSIFVNPTQFAPEEDLDQYPRTLEADLKLCDEYGTDLVFFPKSTEMYPDSFNSQVNVEGLNELWEGEHRPTHFQGVTTVVSKLFNIVQAERAYFGQKDYQQQAIIRQMVRDLNIPTEIVNVPTWRDEDGLALSSRNQYLSTEERQAALILSQTLKETKTELQSGGSILTDLKQKAQQQIEQAGLEPDYFAIAHPETLKELAVPQPQIVLLVAAKAGQTRLIDNMLVEL